MENGSSIKEIISTSLDQVRTIVDADTIIGKQIVTPSGVVIIPISKVSMGFASGGLDVPAKKDEAKKNFGGGGGTGVTVSPVGFLTISPEGEVALIPMVPEKTSPIEQIADIIDNAPAVIGRIKDIFAGVTANKAEEAATESAADELEALYEQKLAQDANEGTDEIIEETEKILEDDELPVSKEEQKRLKKEAKERRKMEKQAEKEAAKEGRKQIDSLEADPFKKKGKISEKTIENGIVK